VGIPEWGSPLGHSIPTMGMPTQESPPCECPLRNPHCGDPHHPMGIPIQESLLWEFLSGDPHLGIPTMGIYTRGRAIMYGWSKGAGGCASRYGGAGGLASWKEVMHHGMGCRGSRIMAGDRASWYGVQGVAHHGRRSCITVWGCRGCRGRASWHDFVLASLEGVRGCASWHHAWVSNACV